VAGVKEELEDSKTESVGEPIDSPYPRLHALNLDASFAAPAWYPHAIREHKRGRGLICASLAISAGVAFIFAKLIPALLGLVAGSLGLIIVNWIVGRKAGRRSNVPDDVVAFEINHLTDDPISADMRALGFKKFFLTVYSEGWPSTVTQFNSDLSLGVWNALNHRQRLALWAASVSGVKSGLDPDLLFMAGMSSFGLAIYVLFRRPESPGFEIAFLAALAGACLIWFSRRPKRVQLSEKSRKKFAEWGLLHDLESGLQTLLALEEMACKLRKERAKRS
jgi:hypothetical protein